MKVSLSLGAGHPDQPDIEADYVQVYTADAANLNQNLAKIVVPMLKCLQQMRQGVPSQFNSLHEEQFGRQLLFDFVGTDEENERALELGMRKWHAAVKEMIWAFEQYVDDPTIEDPRTQNGLRLFAEHFNTLWN
jgi:hypothetical protein